MIFNRNLWVHLLIARVLLAIWKEKFSGLIFMMNLRIEITGKTSGNKTESFLHQGWTCFCFYIINIIIHLLHMDTY